MLTRISKTFRWEMAHRLPFHTAGCRNVHGHSYSMTVELAGEPDANGMLIDYFDVKSIVQPFVDEVDHAFLCDISDKLIVDFLKQSDLKGVFVDFPTTAENIAAWFFRRLAEEFVVYKNIRELRISVAETENSNAEVKGEIRVDLPNTRVLEHHAHMLE
jgi:6-pyruvoyltetrahydropterin/6-carboxytetrahydropterin synthase